MKKIQSKDELIKIVNSLDRTLSKAKTALYHFNELMHYYHNGYKEVMRAEEGYWNSVALAFLDSCAMQLSVFYDKQVTGSKGDQTNATMEYFLSQLKSNQLVHSWVPDYHKSKLIDLRKDWKEFVDHPARSELDRLRNKNLAHKDLNQLLGHEKPVAMEIKKFGELIKFGSGLLTKYEGIFEYGISSKVITVHSWDDRIFESISPGLRSILVKLKKSNKDQKRKNQTKVLL